MVAVDFSPPPAYSRSPSTSTDPILTFRPELHPLSNSSKEHDYVYSSGTTSLNLGPKQEDCVLPAYGRQGTIRGSIQLKDVASLKRLTVTVTGVVSISHIEKGQLSQHRQQHTVLQHALTLWSPTNNTPPSHSYLFSILLPVNARGSTSPLPPTTSLKYQNFQINIRYKISVRVIHKGFRGDEDLATEFLYLPRSRPLDAAPSSPVYGPTYTKPETLAPSSTQWKMIEARRSSAEAEDSVQLGLSLPMSYVSSAPVPFRVAFTSPVEDPEISVQLIKTTSFILDGHNWKFSAVVGTGHLLGDQKEWPSFVEGEVWFDGVLEEASWELADVIDVNYSIKLKVTPRADLPSFECQQTIHLATHSLNDSNNGPSSWRLPASARPIQVGKKKRDWPKVFSSRRSA